LLILIVHWPIIQWLTYLLYVGWIVKKMRGEMLIVSFWLTEKNSFLVIAESISLLFLYVSCVLLVTYFFLKLHHYDYSNNHSKKLSQLNRKKLTRDF
jgi:hypothetical protein